MNKTVNFILGLIVAVILLAGAFSGGFIVGQMMPAAAPVSGLGDLLPSAATPQPGQQAATPEDLQTLFTPFWQAWNVVHEQYVDQPVDDVKLMQGAIRGMMEAVGDDHTSYMEPELYETQTDQLETREYEGIGAYVDTGGDYLTIISPIEGSPADQAGLMPDDQVIAIDGEDMTGVSPEEARLKVLGPQGTEVTLTVLRAGETEPLEFVVKRAKITIRSAEGKMLENGIAYVDINTFGATTKQEFHTTMDNLLEQNPRGIIIDLRNNGGGYLATAVDLTSEFVEEGVILYEEYGDGRRDEHKSLGNGRATDIPLVVLINEGSASASEILAGALQDYGRAKLVGVQSYGKGSVQNWLPLTDNQGAVRVTIARWLTPNGRQINDVGLTPDVIVEMTPEDYENNLDPQLDAAVETLLAMLNGDPIPTSQPTSIPFPAATPVHP